MLVLTRRIGEAIVVGDDVSFMVLGIKGNHISIGINAPKEVSVHREEVYRRIRREQKEQAGEISNNRSELEVIAGS